MSSTGPDTETGSDLQAASGADHVNERTRPALLAAVRARRQPNGATSRDLHSWRTRPCCYDWAARD